MQFCWGPCHDSINQLWNRGSPGFYQLPFHWVRDNRHSIWEVFQHMSFTSCVKEAVLHKKDCWDERLRYVVLHGLWKEGLLKSKAGSALQMRAQVPAARFLKRPHFIRSDSPGLWHPPCNHKILCSSSSLPVECPTARMVSRTLRQSRSPSCGWLHTSLAQKTDCVYTTAVLLHHNKR